jgi:hypothetical protein
MVPRLALASLLCLTGCTPVSMWYQDGASISSRDRTQTDCEVKALQAVPVASQTRLTPVRVIPIKICDSTGKCEVDYEMIGGDAYTVDVNAPLRTKVLAQCVADKGYRPVEIPACPPAIARAAANDITTTLPRLTANSCAITRPNGVQIVTKG